MPGPNSEPGCRSCNSDPPPHPAGAHAAPRAASRIAVAGERRAHASPQRTCSPNRRISALCKRDRLSMVSLRQTAIRQTRVGNPKWAPIR
ncbi:hypothetical protein [Azospirillum largimobile]